MDSRITRTPTASHPQEGTIRFLTTENPATFSPSATIFIGHKVEAHQVTLT